MADDAGAPARYKAPPRERITKGRLVGHVTQWKGKYGWIKPSEPIDHPDAQKRGGKLFVAMEDVDGSAKLKQKMPVSFFLYADSEGLGAMHCRPSAEAEPWRPASGVIKTILKPKGGAKGSIKGEAKGSIKGGAKGGKGSMTQVARPKPSVWPDPAAGGKAGRKAGGKARGKASGKAGGKASGKAGGKVRGKAKEGEEEKEKKPRQPPPAPDKASRERVSEEKITGKLVRWGGHMGWIRPLEPIDHPDFEKHKGGVYLHEVDVDPLHELWRGAQVSFFLYADADGLGAEECMPTEEQPPQSEAKDEADAGGKGKKARRGKGSGGGKGGAALAVPGVKKTMMEKTREKRKDAKGKGKGKEDGAEQKPLERERITDVPVTGEVLQWKRKFGFLKLNEALEHEKAVGHDGRIYVHQKDLLTETPPDPEPGQQVEFHVYADARGLGAEECLVLA